MRNIFDFFYTIGSMSRVYELANLLVEDWGMEFYLGDEYRGKDRKGRSVTRINIFNEKDKVCFLSEKGLEDEELVAAFDDLIEQCVEICKDNKISFADILCAATEYYQRKETPTFDDDAEECNRQFRSMMDENDAWGNID